MERTWDSDKQTTWGNETCGYGNKTRGKKHEHMTKKWRRDADITWEDGTLGDVTKNWRCDKNIWGCDEKNNKIEHHSLGIGLKTWDMGLGEVRKNLGCHDKKRQGCDQKKPI